MSDGSFTAQLPAGYFESIGTRREQHGLRNKRLPPVLVTPNESLTLNLVVEGIGLHDPYLYLPSRKSIRDFVLPSPVLVSIDWRARHDVLRGHFGVCAINRRSLSFRQGFAMTKTILTGLVAECFDASAGTPIPGDIHQMVQEALERTMHQEATRQAVSGDSEGLAALGRSITVDEGRLLESVVIALARRNGDLAVLAVA